MTLLTHKWVLTALAMLAFAGNSVLCRAALQDSAIDPASFTTIRLLAGAITLAALVALRGNNIVKTGSWLSAWAYRSTSDGRGVDDDCWYQLGGLFH